MRHSKETGLLNLKQINPNNQNKQWHREKNTQRRKKLSKASVTSTKISNDIKYMQGGFQKEIRDRVGKKKCLKK